MFAEELSLYLQCTLKIRSPDVLIILFFKDFTDDIIPRIIDSPVVMSSCHDRQDKVNKNLHVK